MSGIWKPNVTGKMPEELHPCDKIEVLFGSGEKDVDIARWWRWELPNSSKDVYFIAAYRIVEKHKPEPVRQQHVAKASLFEPRRDEGFRTGHGHMGDHKFYLLFETVDGKIDYESMKAVEVL